MQIFYSYVVYKSPFTIRLILLILYQVESKFYGFEGFSWYLKQHVQMMYQNSYSLPNLVSFLYIFFHFSFLSSLSLGLPEGRICLRIRLEIKCTELGLLIKPLIAWTTYEIKGQYLYITDVNSTSIRPLKKAQQLTLVDILEVAFLLRMFAKLKTCHVSKHSSLPHRMFRKVIWSTSRIFPILSGLGFHV